MLAPNSRLTSAKKRNHKYSAREDSLNKVEDTRRIYGRDSQEVSYHDAQWNELLEDSGHEIFDQKFQICMFISSQIQF